MDIISTNILSNGLAPSFECVVTEMKNEEGKTYKAHFIDHTTLKVAKEEDSYKIVRIETVAKMTILHDE